MLDNTNAAQKSLNFRDDAKLFFGLDWYEDSRSYTVKLYTYLENASVHPKDGTIEYMHPLALLIQSRKKDCPTWNEVEAEGFWKTMRL